MTVQIRSDYTKDVEKRNNAAEITYGKCVRVCLPAIKKLVPRFLLPPLLFCSIPPFFSHTISSVVMIDECIRKQRLEAGEINALFSRCVCVCTHARAHS